MRARLLAVIRQTVSTVDAAAVWLLAEPRPMLVVENVEPEPTVPDYLQHRIATHEAWCTQQLERIAGLQARLAALAPRMAEIEAERAQQEQGWN